MEVYFASARVKEFRRWWVPKESILQKMEGLFFAAGLDGLVEEGEKVGIKLHMGEPGNVHYLRPVYASRLVDIITGLGGKVEVVETAGLGTTPGRTSASKHLEAARKNGFCEETLGAPLVMADGEEGLGSVEVEGVPVAKGIAELNSLLVLSHATGHIQAGFGGALKNLGLGCVAKAGKFRVHNEGRPWIDDDLCNACGDCLAVCTAEAISGEPLKIGEECVICGSCPDVCGRGAISTKMTSPKEVSRRVAENTAGVVKALDGRLGYLNILMDVLPHCDCHPHSDIPIIPDIGILASQDPVAIDQASIDMIKSAPGVVGSEAEDSAALDPGMDKLQLINPETKWWVQLETAEEMGLGEREYSLEEL